MGVLVYNDAVVGTGCFDGEIILQEYMCCPLIKIKAAARII